MRHLLIWGGVGAVSLALIVPTFADPPGSVRGVGLSTSQTATADGPELVQSTRGVYVHDVSLICSTAPCELALYDSASAASGAGTLKWEGRVAVNNGSYEHSFSAPLATLTGLRVEVSGAGGNAFTSYEP